MELDPAIRTEPLANAPMLQKFALSLCGTIDRAEDLVQETFLQAIANIDTFQPGTNLSAWLVTILRNRFLGQCRKRRREVEDVEGYYAETLKSEPEQTAQVDFADFRAALSKLRFRVNHLVRSFLARARRRRAAGRIRPELWPSAPPIFVLEILFGKFVLAGSQQHALRASIVPHARTNCSKSHHQVPTFSCLAAPGSGKPQGLAPPTLNVGLAQ